jgi:Icc-related predicted phosphoesterase
MGWAYQQSHNSAFKRYNMIEEGTDIIITHGPAKGILDITAASNGYFEQVGDKHLLNKIIEINPLLHISGHLHSETNVQNSGIYQNNNLCQTKFINASVVNLRHNVVGNGHLIEI